MEAGRDGGRSEGAHLHRRQAPSLRVHGACLLDGCGTRADEHFRRGRGRPSGAPRRGGLERVLELFDVEFKQLELERRSGLNQSRWMEQMAASVRRRRRLLPS